MPTCLSPAEKEMKEDQVSPRTDLRVGLLTGGFDRPYAFGITMALSAQGIAVDVLGGAEVSSPEMHTTPGVQFLDTYGDPRSVSGLGKITRVLKSYVWIISYALNTRAGILHILWNNKFPFFDRTALMLFYRGLGKRVVFTAHNVNAGKRDGNDSWHNQLGLKSQYQLANHIFVHTAKMKDELLKEYGVKAEAVTVIPFGINNSVPDTDLSPLEAKRKLGLRPEEKTILFFGAIRPYKGLEHLVAAFQQIAAKDKRYRLIIAGESKKGSEQYWLDIKQAVESDPSRTQVIQKIEFVPDEETELYFKAADVTVLPYTEVFQSGVLFLAYSFGLPAIATDVGSFRDDILPGQTGYVCRSCRPHDLAESLETFFASELYRDLGHRRAQIRDFANSRNSWSVVGEMTRKVYENLLHK